MDFESLGIRVSTSGVTEADSQLIDLTKSAGAAETAAESLAPAIRNVGAASRSTAQAAGQAAVATRQVLDPLTLTYRTVAVEQAKQVTNMGAAALTARQYSFALRQLPMQITDIVTGLVSGQPAYMVAIQQGGQLRDVFGGFGNAMRALGTIITPATLAIGGVAVVTGGLVAAIHRGQKENFEFAKSIILSGNAADTTGGQLRQYAQDIDAIIGTEANAAAVLAKLTSTGRVANDQLREVALATVQLQKVAGVAVEQTVKEFVALGEKPTEASARLTRQYNYLSTAQLRNIRELEETGRLTEAAALAQQYYASSISGRIPMLERDLGGLQRAARGTGAAFSEMWDSVRMFDGKTPREILNDIDRRLAGAPVAFAVDGFGGVGFGPSRAEREQLEAERRRLLSMMNPDDYASRQAAAEQRRRAEAGEVEVELLRRNRTEKERLLRDAEQARRDQFAANLAALERGLSAELQAYDNQLTELEARRSAGLISDEQYYAGRKRLIQASTSATVTALEAENAKLAAETRRAQSDAAAAKAAADNLKDTGSLKYIPALEESDRKRREAQTVQIENQERIKRNLAEINAQHAEEASQLQVLSINHEAAGKRAKQAYEDQIAAGERYLGLLERQAAREVAGQFTGRRDRDFNSGLASIEDKHTEQRQALERELAAASNEDAKRRLRRQLEVHEDYARREVELYRWKWEQLAAGQGNWLNGARAALIDYVDSTRDVAGGTYDALSSTLRQAEEKLLDFFLTGKLGWKEFADAAIREILRVQLQLQISRLIDYFTPLREVEVTATRIEQRAAGGPIEPNRPYLVGERGPELRVFGAPGSIIPNHQLKGGGGGVTVVQHITVAAGVDQMALAAAFRQLNDESFEKFRAVVAEDAMRGRGVWSRMV